MFSHFEVVEANRHVHTCIRIHFKPRNCECLQRREKRDKKQWQFWFSYIHAFEATKTCAISGILLQQIHVFPFLRLGSISTVWHLFACPLLLQSPEESLMTSRSLEKYVKISFEGMLLVGIRYIPVFVLS